MTPWPGPGHEDHDLRLEYLGCQPCTEYLFGATSGFPNTEYFHLMFLVSQPMQNTSRHVEKPLLRTAVRCVGNSLIVLAI
jgi:hypothetical protein